MSDRICPQCHVETTERVCPEDGFPTVLSAPFRPMTSDPLVGTLVDERYRILGRLGQGGMGVVYKATQVSVDRTVALKFLRRDLASSLTDIARFQQEARAVAALRHPNTVRLFDFGQADEGNLYLVLECLSGESLADLIAREAPLRPTRVIGLATQMLESLAEAHDAGIVHRDLKPENLFLAEVFGKKDFLKVLDFGVVKMQQEVGLSANLTGTGVAIGSPRYMAPEQACAEEVSPASDLYALGGILYELLTGAPVFRHALAMECLIAHMRESPPPPCVAGDELKGILVDLVMSCLSKLPSGRPQSAQDMLETLRAMPAEDEDLAWPVSVEATAPPGNVVHDRTTMNLADASREPTLDLTAAWDTPTLDLKDVLPTTLLDQPVGPPVAPPTPPAPRLLGMGLVALSLLAMIWWVQQGSGDKGVVEAGALLRVPPVASEGGEPEIAPAVLRPVPGRTIIHSVPSSAQVLDDATVMGRTPLTVVWDPKEEPPDLKLELRGFHTASLNLKGAPVLEHVVHLKKLNEAPPPSPMGAP